MSICYYNDLLIVPVQLTNHIASFTCSYATEDNHSFSCCSEIRNAAGIAPFWHNQLQCSEVYKHRTVTRRLSSIAESKLFRIERLTLNKMVFIAALLVGVMSVGAVVTMAVSGSVHMLKTVEKDNRREQDLLKSRTTSHNQYQAVY